jgi:hypothetical protein
MNAVAVACARCDIAPALYAGHTEDDRYYLQCKRCKCATFVLPLAEVAASWNKSQGIIKKEVTRARKKKNKR